MPVTYMHYKRVVTFDVFVKVDLPENYDVDNEVNGISEDNQTVVAVSEDESDTNFESMCDKDGNDVSEAMVYEEDPYPTEVAVE